MKKYVEFLATIDDDSTQILIVENNKTNKKAIKELKELINNHYVDETDWNFSWKNLSEQDLPHLKKYANRYGHHLYTYKTIETLDLKKLKSNKNLDISNIFDLETMDDDDDQLN